MYFFIIIIHTSFLLLLFVLYLRISHQKNIKIDTTFNTKSNRIQNNKGILKLKISIIQI